MSGALATVLIIAGSLIGFVWLCFFAALLPLNRSWKRVDHLLSVCASLVRCGAGMYAASTFTRGPVSPSKRVEEELIIVYEYEACPFCRMVRETLTVLELDFEMRPCPMVSFEISNAEAVNKGLSRHRADLQKQQVPFMVDGDIELYESGRIIQYLLQKHADKAPPPAEPTGSWAEYGGKLQDAANLVSSCMASHLRGMPHMGLIKVPSKLAALPIEFVSYEGHPGCRLVREALCCLEMRYIVRSAPLGTGKVEGRRPPWLTDPNTGFESDNCKACIKYLYKEYAIGEPDLSITWLKFTKRRLNAWQFVLKGLFVSVGPISI